jgi:hypothetical protein
MRRQSPERRQCLDAEDRGSGGVTTNCEQLPHQLLRREHVACATVTELRLLLVWVLMLMTVLVMLVFAQEGGHTRDGLLG